MAAGSNNICPTGTWCISYTTGGAIVVILALSVYIAYVHLVAHNNKHQNTPYLQSAPTNHQAPFPESVPPSPQSVPPSPQSTPPSAPVTIDNKWTHTTASHLSPHRVTNVYSNTTLATPHEVNMLRPPWRTTPDTTTVGLMPINIKTRGETPEMQQVGILRSKSNDKVLALYGRPTYRGSSKWIYYTGTDKYHSIKLPVEKNKRDCTAEYGCEEMYDDEEVTVKGYNEVFQTSIYQLDAPRYIPFVV